MTESARAELVLVMAHPDDLEIWAGGVACLHGEFGRVAALVEGQGHVRRNEAKAGAAILGVDLFLTDEITTESCAEFLRNMQPRVLVTHHAQDTHRDHRRVSGACLSSLPEVRIETGRPLAAFMCDTYESITMQGALSATDIVDISAAYARKMLALQAHSSQPLDHFNGMVDSMSTMWGRRAGVDRAEAFVAVPILGVLPSRSALMFDCAELDTTPNPQS